MIQIAERLMENFRNVKSHLQLLVNPLLAKNKSLSIQAVRNDQGNVIEGALCLTSAHTLLIHFGIYKIGFTKVIRHPADAVRFGR